MARNKHGLSRRIPAEIKRIIRQDTGFGCVVCGQIFCEYEHIAPEFNDAKVHDPEHMTMLCHQCHGKVTRGLISKSDIWKAKKKPAAKESGFSREVLKFNDTGSFVAIFGPNVAYGCSVALSANYEPVIWVKPPEINGDPWLFNAKFWNANGDVFFCIEDNEWVVNSKNWDVEIKGSTIYFRDEARNIALEIEWLKGQGINVKKSNLFIAGHKIQCTNKEVKVTFSDGAVGIFGGNVMYVCETAFNI